MGKANFLNRIRKTAGSAGTVRIAAVLGRKGGIGKTTTAANLAAALAMAGRQVLAVDADSQGHMALALGVERLPLFCEWASGGDLLSLDVAESGPMGADEILTQNRDFPLSGDTPDWWADFVGEERRYSSGLASWLEGSAAELAGDRVILRVPAWRVDWLRTKGASQIRRRLAIILRRPIVAVDVVGVPA